VAERPNRLGITLPEHFAKPLYDLVDVMLKSKTLGHLADRRACLLYLLSLGAQKVQEELDRDA
jgi:hypothetical protein